MESLAQLPARVLLSSSSSSPGDLLPRTAAAPADVATEVGNEVVGVLAAAVGDEGLDALGKHFHGHGDLARGGQSGRQLSHLVGIGLCSRF